ncbi:MAG: transposase [Candidatus Thermoplasmatota archaeon]|nr:transposase [Candidatus Thermoplasmatota archaeon]MDA8143768.1 transposase [Thermoplasmatales archaeon]
MEELDKNISEIVRSAVKVFMESLMKGEIQAFLEENEGQRNGYHERDLGTRYGKINGLRVPRGRVNEFQMISPHLFWKNSFSTVGRQDICFVDAYSNQHENSRSCTGIRILHQAGIR